MLTNVSKERINIDIIHNPSFANDVQIPLSIMAWLSIHYKQFLGFTAYSQPSNRCPVITIMVPSVRKDFPHTFERKIFYSQCHIITNKLNYHFSYFYVFPDFSAEKEGWNKRLLRSFYTHRPGAYYIMFSDLKHLHKTQSHSFVVDLCAVVKKGFYKSL